MFKECSLVQAGGDGVLGAITEGQLLEVHSPQAGESEGLKKDIRLMLTETIRRPTTSNLMLGPTSTRKRQELATYMGSLLEEIAKGETAQSENTSVQGTQVRTELQIKQLNTEEPLWLALYIIQY